jgi:excisionase family DNA binding protein
VTHTFFVHSWRRRVSAWPTVRMVNFTKPPLGTSATARALQLSESRVRQLAAMGELPAIRTTGGQFLFDPADVEHYAERRAERQERRRGA